MQNLISLFQQYTGQLPKNMEPLPKTGSNRLYVRLTSSDDSTVIGVVNSNIAENRSFIYLSRHFGSKGFPVPQILAVGKEENCYLQTDLGHTTLYGVLKESRQATGGFGDAEFALIDRTLRLLAHLQTEGARGLDFQQCLSPNTFDVMSAMFDLNYFKYCYLRPSEISFDEVRFEQDIHRLAHDLTDCDEGQSTFLYRDFQARNVMLYKGEQPYFIDYQGGRKGPLPYDVASFLWQASAHYPETLRERMIEAYLDELSGLIPVNKENFHSQLRLFVLFRNLQVLGAYGYRGLYERKKYFLDSIPSALQNLKVTLSQGVCAAYPYLEETLLRIVEPSQSVVLPAMLPKKAELAKEEERTALVVRVFSFSYKKGIPEDVTGNGGGYVFDCRATHNPGRYEPYKQLTGLDEPVIRFLEDDGEILEYLRHVYTLIDPHVHRYLQRKFTDLQISFGCTGGQHRSVYCAQHLAEHIHEKFKIEVRICHREQNITQTLTVPSAMQEA